MENFKRDKIERVLGIYTKLLNGHVIDKSAESVNYGVNERTLSIWEDENFRKLARRVTDILGVRTRVENCVLSAADDSELTSMLERIV